MSTVNEELSGNYAEVAKISQNNNVCECDNVGAMNEHKCSLILQRNDEGVSPDECDNAKENTKDPKILPSNNNLLNGSRPSICIMNSIVGEIDKHDLNRSSILYLVLRIIFYHDLQKKYELPIDAEYIQCLQELTKTYPQFFFEFETAMHTIIKDGTVSVSDIPELVKLMHNLYEIINNIKKKTNIELCAGLLKLLFFVYIKENLVVVEDETLVLIAFDSLIDSITELLKLHMQLSTPSCSTVMCNLMSGLMG